MERCEAAEAVKLRNGVGSAFDYIVGKKLLNHAEPAGDWGAVVVDVIQMRRRVEAAETARDVDGPD